MKTETVERMDYYHIPQEFNKYINLEKKLIYSRYKFAVENISNGSDLLEIGCGYGSGSKLLNDTGGKHKSYIGIDLSQDSISAANDEYSEFGKFFESDAETLPVFQKDTFDNVISFENIEHLKNPRKSLIEIFRVLKSGGLLILSTPNRRNWGLADKNPFHYRHFSWCQIIAEAEECGFDLVKSSGIYFSPSNFRLAVIFSVLGIDIKKLINDVPTLLNLFFFLGRLFPKRARLLLFVFKKRDGFPIEKYYQ
jgi:ubiquinone/menaquinone biosynthesis C-methylase UbiE